MTGRNRGFTLTELIIAVGLTIILIGVVFFAFRNASEAQRRTMALVEIATNARTLLGSLAKEFEVAVNYKKCDTVGGGSNFEGVDSNPDKLTFMGLIDNKGAADSLEVMYYIKNENLYRRYAYLATRYLENPGDPTRKRSISSDACQWNNFGVVTTDLPDTAPHMETAIQTGYGQANNPGTQPLQYDNAGVLGAGPNPSYGMSWGCTRVGSYTFPQAIPAADEGGTVLDPSGPLLPDADYVDAGDPAREDCFLYMYNVPNLNFEYYNARTAAWVASWASSSKTVPMFVKTTVRIADSHRIQAKNFVMYARCYGGTMRNVVNAGKNTAAINAQVNDRGGGYDQ